MVSTWFRAENGSEAVFTNVLVGVDSRPGGRDAIALALRLVEPDGARTLAHVLSGDDKEARDAVEARLSVERERADAYEPRLVPVEAPRVALASRPRRCATKRTQTHVSPPESNYEVFHAALAGNGHSPR